MKRSWKGARRELERKAGGALAWALLLFLPALALTPAGTFIRNQALAEASGERYLSNVAETVVQPLCRPALSPGGTPEAPGLRVNVTPGGYAYLPYRLQNAGNSAFTFALTHAIHASSSWNPVEVRFYLDLNANALPDPGEPEVSEVVLGMGEEAALVLALRVPPTAAGSLFLSPVASCPGGERDEENYAQVEASAVPEPSLFLTKTASPAALLPGERATFTLRLRNLGNGEASGPILLTDPLGGLEGLRYVPGSASAPKGQVEFFDGGGWSTVEPPSVLGVRLRLDRLLPGEEATLSFQVEALPTASPGRWENRARAEGPGGPAEGVAVLEVLPLYRHHLGPLGNPKALPGGEGSGDDLQEARGLVGQPHCFRHTLLNEGTAQDLYRIRVEGAPVRLLTLSGTPLPEPIPLGPGESLDFLACLDPGEPGTLEATLVAVSLRGGQENRTVDRLEVLPAGALVLRKEADPAPGTTLKAGESLTYALVVENRFAPLPKARVEDRLPPWVEFLEAEGGSYEPENHAVVFLLDPLPTGETRLTVRVRVREDAPDDALLQNRFTLVSEATPNPLVSNEVRHPLLSANLALDKGVAPQEASPGDLLTYTLKVTNPSGTTLEVRLADTPDPHLAYIPGTAKGGPCGGASAPLEPRVEEGVLRWTLSLGPRESFCLSYRMRVLPGATGSLNNLAEAQGLSAQGAATARVQARALARVRLGTLGLERGVLVGRVYLDVNENGRYEPGTDVPLPGARVVLANGWQALTDREGRYAFRDLEPGVWQVMLDPSSAPFPPLPHPEALGEGYRHGVRVQGLTVSDFPLKSPKGFAKAYRETTLRFGPLTLEKRLIPTGNGFRVVLLLRSSEPLEELTVRDPTPDGGEKVFTFARFEGEETLLYEYAVEAPFMSDPQVRWRYP